MEASLNQLVQRLGLTNVSLVFSYPSSTSTTDINHSIGTIQDPLTRKQYKVYIPKDQSTVPLSSCNNNTPNQPCQVEWKDVYEMRDDRRWVRTGSSVIKSHVSNTNLILQNTYQEKVFTFFGDLHIENTDGNCNLVSNNIRDQIARDPLSIANFVIDYARNTSEIIDFFVEAAMEDTSTYTMKETADRVYRASIPNVRVHYIDLRQRSFYKTFIGIFSTIRNNHVNGLDLDANVPYYDNNIDWYLRLYRLFFIHASYGQLLEHISNTSTETVRNNRLVRQFTHMMNNDQQVEVYRILSFYQAFLRSMNFVSDDTRTVLELLKERNFDAITSDRQYESILTWFYKIDAAFFDLYMLARMIRKYPSKKGRIAGDVKSAFVFAGDAHLQRYATFMNAYRLAEDNQVEVEFVFDVLPQSPIVKPDYIVRVRQHAEILFFVPVVLEYYMMIKDRRLFELLPIVVQEYITTDERVESLLQLVILLIKESPVQTELAFYRRFLGMMHLLSRGVQVENTLLITEYMSGDLQKKLVDYNTKKNLYHRDVYPLYLQVLESVSYHDRIDISYPYLQCTPIHLSLYPYQHVHQPVFVRLPPSVQAQTDTVETDVETFPMEDFMNVDDIRWLLMIEQ